MLHGFSDATSIGTDPRSWISYLRVYQRQVAAATAMDDVFVLESLCEDSVWPKKNTERAFVRMCSLVPQLNIWIDHHRSKLLGGLTPFLAGLVQFSLVVSEGCSAQHAISSSREAGSQLSSHKLGWAWHWLVARGSLCHPDYDCCVIL